MSGTSSSPTIVSDTVTLVVSILVFAASVSTLVHFRDMEKDQDCKITDQSKVNFIKGINYAAAIGSGLLILFMLILLLSAFVANRHLTKAANLIRTGQKANLLGNLDRRFAASSLGQRFAPGGVRRGPQ